MIVKRICTRLIPHFSRHTPEVYFLLNDLLATWFLTFLTNAYRLINKLEPLLKFQSFSFDLLTLFLKENRLMKLGLIDLHDALNISWVFGVLEAVKPFLNLDLLVQPVQLLIIVKLYLNRVFGIEVLLTTGFLIRSLNQKLPFHHQVILLLFYIRYNHFQIWWVYFKVSYRFQIRVRMLKLGRVSAAADLQILISVRHIWLSFSLYV